MGRDYNPKERAKKSKARREFALARIEFREPSAVREPANGATSFSIKRVDDDVRAMIDAALAKKRESAV